MKSIPLFLLTLPISFSILSARADLLVNGSFEDPPLPGVYQYVPGGSSLISGWSTVLEGVERWSAGYPSVPGPVPDGLYVIDLNTDTVAGGGIEQTLATIIGQKYKLTFEIGTSTAVGRSGIGEVSVDVGQGVNVFSIQNFTSIVNWSPQTHLFTATNNTTTIRFNNFDAPSESYAILDNVSLTAIPEPNSLAVFLIGTLAACLRQRRTRVNRIY